MAYPDKADDESSLDDPELPDYSDMDHDEGDEYAETLVCPYCGKAMFEQAEVCPHCGQYISAEETSSRKPLWIIVGVVICVIIILILLVLKF